MNRVDRYRLLSRYAKRQAPHLLLLAVLGVLPAGLAALQPLPLKLFVDNALAGRPVTGLPTRLLDLIGVGNDARSLAIVAALAATVLTVGSFLAAGLASLYLERVGARMVGHVARDLFDHLQRLSPLFHARTFTGDSLSRITTDSSAVYTAVNALLVAPAMKLLTLAAVGWSAWRLDPGLTLVVLASAPVLAVVSRGFSIVLKRRAARARDDQVRVMSFVTQVVHALPVVQAFTAERDNLRTFRSIADRSLDASRRTVLAEAAAHSVAIVIGALGTALVLVVGGRGVLQGSSTVGELIVFLAYMRTLDTQFGALLGIGRQLRLAEVGLGRIHEVLASTDRIREPTYPVSLPTTTRGSKVVWDHVQFGYEPGRPVLHDVTLSVEAGQTVAIVGRTGSGKSTLVSLVPRLLDPWSGRVTIDGLDLRDAAVAEVRRRVAVVRQDPLILPVSIAENIAIGRPGASRADIERAAAQALAAEFIDQLPDGYETVLAPNGTGLSGGQRQRLAIARALLKRAPILILDEPTSALDPESEAKLVESLARLPQERTVLVIAHRLSTVRAAERVIVIDGGRVVESGTHEELVAADGLYANAQRLQMIEVTT